MELPEKSSILQFRLATGLEFVATRTRFFTNTLARSSVIRIPDGNCCFRRSALCMPNQGGWETDNFFEGDVSCSCFGIYSDGSAAESFSALYSFFLPVTAI